MAKNIHKIIEKQMSFWRIQRDSVQEVRRGPYVPPNVITLSNAFGSNGVGVAHKVGEMLGIPVYDREIVEHIATTAKVRLQTVETLDEVVQSELDGYIAALFRERRFDQGDYLQALTRTIMGLWGHGPCVMIGRGATHIVYRKHSLSVRVIANMPFRLRFVQQLENIDEEAAQRRIQRMDTEREGFIRRLFSEEIDDPLMYDLTVNRTGMTDEQCAALIVEAYRQKLGSPKKP